MTRYLLGRQHEVRHPHAQPAQEHCRSNLVEAVCAAESWLEGAAGLRLANQPEEGGL